MLSEAEIAQASWTLVRGILGPGRMLRSVEFDRPCADVPTRLTRGHGVGPCGGAHRAS